MNQYVLSCCSTADLSAKHFADRNISYVCFHFSLDGRDYPDDLGQTIPYPDFYAAMKNGSETKTSQVSVGEYVEYFTSFLSEGKDILHLSLSSGISGSYKSALAAKELLEDKFPERKLYIVDSLAASSGYGLLMDHLADLRDSGFSLDQLYDWVLENRLKLHHWFFTSDLTFFIKGGRISKASGTIGGLLGICPLLNVSLEGKLVPRMKIRSKKRVIQEIVNQMVLNADDGIDYSGKCYICHSACLEDARAVADLVEERFPHLNGKVVINSVGTTIGSHTGPGTVALFFWGKKRAD